MIETINCLRYRIRYDSFMRRWSARLRKMSKPYYVPLAACLDERQVRIEHIADDYFAAWVHGKPALIDAWRGERAPLVKLIADDLVDTPDNPLHEMVALIGDMARAGNARALALINRMALEHAVSTVEMQDMTP